MGVDKYKSRDERGQELVDQIRPLVAELLDNQVPLEEGASTRIMTHAVIVCGRNEYTDDGVLNLVCVMSLEDDLPDYVGIGLLRKGEMMYHYPDMDEED